MMDETVLAQSVSSDRSTITDSNNRGNAGRDIIHNYGVSPKTQLQVYTLKHTIS